MPTLRALLNIRIIMAILRLPVASQAISCPPLCVMIELLITALNANGGLVNKFL